MGTRMGTFLAMAAMFSMASRMNGNTRSDSERIIKPEIKNWQKKCFNPDCENKREYDKLYCSAECCKKDKPRVKALK